MPDRRTFLQQLAAGAASVALQPSLEDTFVQSPQEDRPNILWLTCEDIGPHLGTYGYEHAVTPNLDRLAEEGVQYENAFTTSPVCAPNRSSIATGVYSSSLGTHHMRSGGSGTKYNVEPEIPSHIRLFTEHLRELGYYCTNNGKEDYNFETPEAAWDESSGEAHWRNRPDGQPFFSVFNFTGTHEGSVRLQGEAHRKHTARLDPSERQDPEEVPLPPYYPDTELTRREWAEYYELITLLDYWVGDRLAELEEAGLTGNTIVFFWSDHGVGLSRAKRWAYDSGVRIPLLVRIPEGHRRDGSGEADSATPAPGTETDRVVSSVDFGPTVLNLAGVETPAYMHGRPFLGEDQPEARRYAFSTRDRMDERYDIIRTVRDERYRYVRNYEPFKPYHQFMNTPEGNQFTEEFHRVAEAGELPPGADWFTQETKPVEELYDTREDPHEIHNLAGREEYRDVLHRLRTVLWDWMVENRDLGLIPEPRLVELAEEAGTRWAILRQSDRDHRAFMHRLRAAASLAGTPTIADLPALVDRFRAKEPSIRYWAATGIGNIGPDAATAADLMHGGLSDEAPVVRVAAARALFHLETRETSALPAVVEELRSNREWIRLQAALVLDEIGEKARPAIPALKEALGDVHNKYVVRVANRALNQMLGTNNQVR